MRKDWKEKPEPRDKKRDRAGVKAARRTARNAKNSRRDFERGDGKGWKTRD